jgi:hypothetical protein
MRAAFLILLAVFTPALAAARTPAPDAPREIAGVYELGFERQTFRPCGSGETWWVSTAPATLHRGLGTRAFVRVRATVGPRGAFGHLGKYPRQIAIREVISATGGECPSRR